MNQILYSKNAQKTKIVILILCIAFLMFVLGFFILGLINTKSDKITKGVIINTIDVGNMTKSEAVDLINKQQKNFDEKKYTLVYENREIVVTGAELAIGYSNDYLEEACQYGKNGNAFENSWVALNSYLNKQYYLNSDLVLKEDNLVEKINVLLEEEKSVAVDDAYEVSGDKILLTKGFDGVKPKINNVKSQILENAISEAKEIKIMVDIDTQLAKRIDFDKLYEDVYIEEKNASYEQNNDGTVKFVQEIIGISFDKDAAKENYLNIKEGETLTVALIKELPEVTTSNLDNVLFADVLATYKTTYNAGNVDRSTNLEVAARNINGTILLPGEIFSYNKEVGQRTYANGFKDAHIFSGGKVVDGLGGGICQVSSTLYNAILAVDGIEIVERKNHMMYPEYVKPSLDATVVWGSIDFRFKNTRETPIKIVATVKNGVATTTIYGKKTVNEPIIELQSVIEKTIEYTTVTEYDNTLEEGKTIVTQEPVNGYISKAYKIVKDENGKEISKTLISSDTYKQTSKIITVGTKKVETPTEPQNPTTPAEPSVPSTPEQPSQNPENPQDDESDNWPTGWDTPENPYYPGNH